MGRLIDEDAVKRRMHETMDYQDLYLPVHFEMCMEDAPTIDAVQVVRCGECKYRTIDGFCVLFQQNINGNATKWFMPEDDWFCADGERKVQDGNSR